jgi:hypothetical protein
VTGLIVGPFAIVLIYLICFAIGRIVALIVDLAKKFVGLVRRINRRIESIGQTPNNPPSDGGSVAESIESEVPAGKQQQWQCPTIVAVLLAHHLPLAHSRHWQSVEPCALASNPCSGDAEAPAACPSPKIQPCTLAMVVVHSGNQPGACAAQGEQAVGTGVNAPFAGTAASNAGGEASIGGSPAA